MYRKIAITIISLFSLSASKAQNSETVLSLNREQIEALFLDQNLDLLAKKMEISQVEAQLIQARLWSNPTFEISELNFWKTTDIEEQPPVFGNWGQAQQISLHLEQLIQTAGKRRKNIALQKLSIEEKEKDFESVLRESKLELRNTLSNIQMLQEQQKIYQEQIDNTQSLIKAFKNQLDTGNISQAEYVRLKAAELQFRKELNDVNKELEENLKNLKNFINLKNNIQITIAEKLKDPDKEVSELELEDWILHAQENRPDILLSKNLELQSQKKLEIEKAQRIPDLTFGIDYDRGGNIMRDFIGFGVSFDLPVFDRNKGNIKDAQIEIEIAKLETQNKLNQTANDIVEAYRNYYQVKELYNQIEPDYEQQLDKLLEAYIKNFKLKNISMIEYLDFVEAYLDNKNIMLETLKELNEYFENLQFAVGKDL